MPEMDGFDTARELKQRYSQIKILVLSSLDHKKFITKMLDLGVKGYILKGYASEELKTAVMKLYKGGYYFSETVNSTAVSYLAGNNKF